MKFELEQVWVVVATVSWPKTEDTVAGSSATKETFTTHAEALRWIEQKIVEYENL